MTPFEELSQTCHSQLRGLHPDRADYKARLEDELKEINAQNESEYFLDLAKQSTPLENENNLLVPYLLGACRDFDITKPPRYEYGDMPDIDVDYLPEIRSYLKETYAREQYGEDRVCNIVTYTTFGLRSALIDMAKVFDLDRKEILNLTTRLGIKDDEGEILTWDKAIELYDDLRTYLEQHPDMAEAAKKILHRNRNMGMHASGLIISGVPLNDFVPLVRVRETAQACSAWVEGLHGTDLGAVGLVKFDFLSLDSNMKVAQSTHMVQELWDRANGKIGSESCAASCTAIKKATDLIGGKVAALPGKANWTDLNYLNDPKALDMANRGDLKMIFQYDGSEGIRRLAKQGGVTSFDDLVAYVSIYRPGPMKCCEKNSLVYKKGGWESIEKIKPGHDELAYYNSRGKVKFTKRFIKSEKSKKKLLKITLKNGKTILCSPEHRFLTKSGEFVEAQKINKGNSIGYYHSSI